MYRRWDKSKPPRGPFRLNRDCPQAFGLVTWYPFGGPSAPDYITNLAGSITLSGYLGTPPRATLGDIGQPSYDFVSASTQYKYTGVLPVAAYPFSITGWLKPKSSANHAIASIYGVGGTGVGRKLLFVDTSYAAHAFDQQNAVSGNAGTSAVGALNTWMHAAAVFTSTVSRTAYINGANPATNTTDVTSWASGDGTAIGWDGTTIYCNGEIAEVCMYSIAIGADIVARLNDPSTRFELWYPLRSRKWLSIPGGVASSQPLIVSQAVNRSYTY